jgi:23S rRNA pseudouridine2605 synthase
MERIQKILARGGIASRRAAEQLISAGHVRVNGRVVTELGAKADPRRDRVEVDGKRVVAEEPVYVVLNKPRGVVSTMSDPEGRPTVKELLASIGARVYPVGRLDFATSGVLLATNDGELADGLLHPRKTVPKTYILKVKGVMTPDDLDQWRKGVRLEDGMTLPAEAKLLRHEGDKTWIELTIREGRNQQIRRMGEATGFPVMRLSRVAFAEISGEGLAPGRWRHLTRDELVALKKTYGVPRSIPSTPQQPPTRQTRAVPAARRGAVGRAQRAFGTEGRRLDDAPARSPRPDDRARDGRHSARGSSHAAHEPPKSGSPRYGGGSPGRRAYDVNEDWGGGAGRGSSRGQDRNEQAPRGDLGGGRSGRTRTTGTAGGIGASEPAPRVKGRRGR